MATPTPYITAAQLLQFVSDTFGVPVANLPARWSDQSGNAVTMGFSKLIAFLQTVGYSQAQLTPFDQAVDWNMSQSFCELAGAAGGYSEYKLEWFDRFNIVKLLFDSKGQWSISVNGVPTAPAVGGSAVGGIRSGTLDAGAAFQAPVIHPLIPPLHRHRPWWW
jgi:hypothetical protein